MIFTFSSESSSLVSVPVHDVPLVAVLHSGYRLPEHAWDLVLAQGAAVFQITVLVHAARMLRKEEQAWLLFQ